MTEPNLSENLNNLAWSVTDLAEAVPLLAYEAKLLPELGVLLEWTDTPPQAEGELFDYWLDGLVSRLGLEVEPVQATYPELTTLIQRVGPALLRLPVADASPKFLALLRGGRRSVTVIAPNRQRHTLPIEAIRARLCHDIEAPLSAAIAEMLQAAAVPETRFAKTQATLLNEQLSTTRFDGCWMLRLSPSADLWRQLRLARLWPLLYATFGLQLIVQTLLIISWVIIGSAAIQGHFEWAWLSLWALLILSLIPFQLQTGWLQSLFAVKSSSLFRQRLFHGILKLKPEEMRHEGVGHFIGRIMEVEAFELLALSGGFTALVALTQLGVAIWVLSLGVESWFMVTLLLIWVAGVLGLSWRYLHINDSWMHQHRTMTNDLVERMVGHRTRLAQELPQTWHLDEDKILERYFKQSTQLDQIGRQLGEVIPNGWMIVGLIGLLPILVTQTSATMIAITLGGVILAFQALRQFISGVVSLIAALTAWRQVSPLFYAATRQTEASTSTPAVLAKSTPLNPHVPIVSAQDLVYRYQNRTDPALRGCSLDIYPQERLLLEGPSGGGKSTLAAVLAGLRPAEGRLLLAGYNQQTLGVTTWQRQVVLVPQFHENHVFTETLAFNLLMGRRWPPTAEDLAEAETLCRALGLGELLDRMPAGLQQIVGESGWRLSHGERSRLYIARALLQQPKLIILDESFAALDPKNLQQALTCVLERAPALLVIAHP